MESLQELTGQESGIVLYDTGYSLEGIVCNWSHIKGLPRIDPLGLTVLGFGEEIPETKGIHCEDLTDLLTGVDYLYANDEPMPITGVLYRFQNDGSYVLIVAPDGWN